MPLGGILGSLKNQTSNAASSLFSSLKSQSDKFYKSSDKQDQEMKRKWPNISMLEQLQWPLLLTNSANVRTKGESEEESLVDKFIRIIKIEDEDQNPQSTFYNHPQRRRTDREEIRRKLAMGADEEFAFDRPTRKPSLQSRLQNGMNLQICFMNETASDCESQCSDTESTQDRVDEIEVLKDIKGIGGEGKASDFYSHQAKLQAEAHFALSQAKEMARMQMQIEKQQQKKSPIAEIVRDSFNKIGFPFPDSKRRMSRHILTDMNVAQLQVIVNDLHTQIENLNEDLVKMLLERDDLHMEQDSMLVDIEDLTKHLGAKQKPANGKVGSQGSAAENLLKKPHSPTLKPKSIRLKPLSKK